MQVLLFCMGFPFSELFSASYSTERAMVALIGFLRTLLKYFAKISENVIIMEAAIKSVTKVTTHNKKAFSVFRR